MLLVSGRPNRLKDRLLGDLPNITIKTSTYKKGSQLLSCNWLGVSDVNSYDNSFNNGMDCEEQDSEDSQAINISDCSDINSQSLASILYHVVAIASMP